jgi:CSLREA domain-containing protein
MSPLRPTPLPLPLRGGAWVFTVLLAIGLATPIARASSAGAATTINVTTTVDELNTGGACSLREAVRSANLDQAIGGCPAGSGDDTIMVPAGTFRLTRIGAQEQQAVLGDLDILQSVTITGAGSGATIIDGNATDRVLDVFDPAIVQVNYLTIQNGKPAAGRRGGGIVVLANASLGLFRVIVQNNRTADGPDRTPDGGGIYNDGDMTIMSSVVRNNLAGGNEGSGGGIWNSGSLGIYSSTVGNNTANGSNATTYLIDGGGGIYNVGSMRVNTSTVSGNISKYRGGGIASSGIWQVDIRSSTISGNRGVTGGGLFTKGALTVALNSTISGNFASSHGGGWWSSSNTTLGNVTIAKNTADSDNNGSGDGGGVYVLAAKFQMLDSLFDGNKDLGGQAPGCKVAGGSFWSNGYNHFGGTTGCVISGPRTGDQIGGNAMLGPLQANGGPTFTHALLPGSPAIDAGNGGQDHDQRNVARPKDGNGDGIFRPDMGAFEYNP